MKNKLKNDNIAEKKKEEEAEKRNKRKTVVRDFVDEHGRSKEKAKNQLFHPQLSTFYKIS